MVVMLGASSLAPDNMAPSALLAPSIATASFAPPWATADLSAPDLSAPDLSAPVVVEYVSPSAIETATEELGGCLRKWAWVKLDRVAKSSGQAAALGSAMHAQHELYLESGTPYDLTTRAGELAIATLHLLPAPGVAQVEQEFRVEVEGMGWLGGKIDANWAEPPDARGRRQIVLDHKSTGDIRWAKLERDELLHHPQAPIYASFWWQAGKRQVRVKNSKEWRAWDPGFVPNDIELRWNYVTTKGKPKAVPSWHVVEPEEVWTAFTSHVAPGARRLLSVVQEANETRANGKPFGAMQLPANLSACGAFGGCQFRDRCGVSPLGGVTAMAEQSLAFLSRMGLANAPVAPAPPPIATSPIPAVAQASAPAWAPPQINPPESALPVPEPVHEPEPPPAEPAAHKGPGRPKKEKAEKPEAPPALVAAESVSDLYERALLAVLPACFTACQAQIFAGAAPPSSALELAKAVVAALEGK